MCMRETKQPPLRSLLERESIAATLFVSEGAADRFRLGMKHVLLSLCLTAVAVSAPTALDVTGALSPGGDDAMSTWTVCSSSHPGDQSTEILALQSERDEVHSVVVDMPQVISLAYGSLNPSRLSRQPLRQPKSSRDEA
jgi:hypothetical protein